jgi:hypothetical protein
MTETTLQLCIHFMHFLQITHKGYTYTQAVFVIKTVSFVQNESTLWQEKHTLGRSLS